MKKHSIVVGIGSAYIQDDRAGTVVIEQLEQAGILCRTEVVRTAGFEVLGTIRGYKRAIVVDASALGNPPGTILEATVEDLCSTSLPLNSHTLPLGTTLQTGYLCFPQEMPEDLRIFLIEVKEMKAFHPQMSPEVEAAVAEVVARIKMLISTAG